MRNSTKLKASLFLLSATFGMSASNLTPPDKTPDKEIKDIVIIKKDVPSRPGRPKAPSRQSIDCTYYDGTLSVAFLIPEGECAMTVTDNTTGMSLQYIFSTEEAAEIYVGPLDSAYIEFDTENGNSYEGWLN